MDEMGFQFNMTPGRQWIFVGEEKKLEKPNNTTHYSLMLSVSMEQPLVWMVHKTGTNVLVTLTYFRMLFE
jgi:hypothetical protein